MKIGDKIKIPNQRNRFTIRAFDKRFIIMTKPFNARKTYLYSIIDLQELLRGPDNLIFGNYNCYEKEADKCLKQLQNGEIEISHRRCKVLEPEVLEQINKLIK
jgi:hypothetical protein